RRLGIGRGFPPRLRAAGDSRRVSALPGERDRLAAPLPQARRPRDLPRVTNAGIPLKNGVEGEASREPGTLRSPRNPRALPMRVAAAAGRLPSGWWTDRRERAAPRGSSGVSDACPLRL